MGKSITSLDRLSAAEALDVLAIVDVSDTAEDADGKTKKITADDFLSAVDRDWETRN